MPGKDTTVWRQNEDGSWTRNRAGNQETTYVDPTVETDDKVNATTGAKETAAEHGLDLATIEGTGKDGKVTKADVEAALTQ